MNHECLWKKTKIEKKTENFFNCFKIFIDWWMVIFSFIVPNIWKFCPLNILKEISVFHNLKGPSLAIYKLFRLLEARISFTMFSSNFLSKLNCYTILSSLSVWLYFYRLKSINHFLIFQTSKQVNFYICTFIYVD